MGFKGFCQLGFFGALVLCSNSFAQEPSLALENFVKENRGVIESEGAEKLGLSEISISPDSLKCLGVRSKDEGIVGVCLAEGSLDYANSDSHFSISLSDDEEGSSTKKVRVQLLSSEL